MFFNGFGANVMNNNGMGFYVYRQMETSNRIWSLTMIFGLRTEGARVSYMDSVSAANHEVMNIAN